MSRKISFFDLYTKIGKVESKYHSIVLYVLSIVIVVICFFKKNYGTGLALFIGYLVFDQIIYRSYVLKTKTPEDIVNEIDEACENVK